MFVLFFRGERLVSPSRKSSFFRDSFQIWKQKNGGFTFLLAKIGSVSTTSSLEVHKTSDDESSADEMNNEEQKVEGVQPDQKGDEEDDDDDDDDDDVDDDDDDEEEEGGGRQKEEVDLDKNGNDN